MNYLAGSFSSPDAIAITPDGRYAYVADLFNQVQVIDIATNTIIPTPKLTGVFSPLLFNTHNQSQRQVCIRL